MAEIADSQHYFILWPRFNSTHSYRTAFFPPHLSVWFFKPERVLEKFLFLYEGNESLHQDSAAKMSKNVIVESEILIAFTNFPKQIQNPSC